MIFVCHFILCAFVKEKDDNRYNKRIGNQNAHTMCCDHDGDTRSRVFAVSKMMQKERRTWSQFAPCVLHKNLFFRLMFRRFILILVHTYSFEGLKISNIKSSVIKYQENVPIDRDSRVVFMVGGKASFMFVAWWDVWFVLRLSELIYQSVY